jgi:hypothetical protein
VVCVEVEEVEDGFCRVSVEALISL